MVNITLNIRCLAIWQLAKCGMYVIHKWGVFPSTVVGVTVQSHYLTTINFNLYSIQNMLFILL